jgi:hypothetical protein
MALQRRADALRTSDQSTRAAQAPAEARAGEAAVAQRKYLGSLGRGALPGGGAQKAAAPPSADPELLLEPTGAEGQGEGGSSGSEDALAGNVPLSAAIDAPASPEVASTPTGVAAVPPEKRKMIRQGSAGAEVEYAQERLNAHGAEPVLAVDGLFGPKTRAATSAYQQSHALSPDAIIGPKTWASLDGPVAVGKTQGGGGGPGGGAGAGATTLMYDTARTAVTPPPEGTKKADMQKAVEAQQKAGELGPTVKAEDKGDAALGAHLLNATAQLGTKARWASEVDLQTVVGFKPNGPGERPVGKVTMRLDGAGNADTKLIGTGAVVTAQKYKDLDAARKGLKADFGFANIVDGGANWTLPELNKVDAALQRISSTEKAALAGVDLVRESTILNDKGKPLAGEFSYKHGVATGADKATHAEKLSIADSAFSADGVNFIGGAGNAAEASFETILHEVGHAVEHAEERKTSAAKFDAMAAHNAAVTKMNAANNTQSASMTAARNAFLQLPKDEKKSGTAFANASFAVTNAWVKVTKNNKVAEHDANVKAAQDATTAREKARTALEAKSATHPGLGLLKSPNADVDAWGKTCEDRVAAHKAQELAKTAADGQMKGNESKRLAKFRAFVGKEKLTPPTQYAKAEGMGEWYAEAYSLWKNDPEFLNDQYPKVKKWFDDGEHLKD